MGLYVQGDDASDSHHHQLHPLSMSHLEGNWWWWILSLLPPTRWENFAHWLLKLRGNRCSKRFTVGGGGANTLAPQYTYPGVHVKLFTLLTLQCGEDSGWCQVLPWMVKAFNSYFWRQLECAIWCGPQVPTHVHGSRSNAERLVLPVLTAAPFSHVLWCFFFLVRFFPFPSSSWSTTRLMDSHISSMAEASLLSPVCGSPAPLNKELLEEEEEEEKPER